MAAPKRRSTTAKVVHRSARAKNVETWDTDNYSHALDDLVPEKYAALKHNRYLDVVQWNIEWFGASKSQSKDKARFAHVAGILESINAEIFVFQEVAGPTRNRSGVLDGIAEELTRRGAGEYVVDYTLAGGEQRVAIMWDRDVVRAKTEVSELFPRGMHVTKDGKDAFAQRTPLYGYFTARLPTGGHSGPGGSFDFQLLGVHLKAMGDGAPQRLKSAQVLADWMQGDAHLVDADILIVGDFNAPVDDKKSWKPFHALEDQGKAAFRTINDNDDFSYMWLANKSDKHLSRIDLTVASTASMQSAVPGETAQALRWKPIEDVLAQANGDLTDAQVTKTLKFIKQHISDHLPTISRFYFTEPDL